MGKKKLKVLKTNYFGLDHKAVDKKFKGDLEFVNDFCVNNEYEPVAVYRAANPDTDKGHKKYMLLYVDSSKGMVRGMTEEEMEKWRFQSALHCKNCNHVIYSAMRHTMTSCKCEEGKQISVDGGRDYTKVSFGAKSDYTAGTLDLLTDTFKEN